VSISTEPVGVVEVLTEVKTTLESLAARQGIHVDIDPLPAAFPWCRWIERGLRRSS